MYDSYGIVRLALRYERLFEREFEKIRDNREYHIEAIKAILEHAEEALELEAENMANFGANIQTIYTLDDVNTLWEKFQVLIMKWYVNWMYSRSVRESEYLGIGREKLKKLLNRLIMLSAF